VIRGKSKTKYRTLTEPNWLHKQGQGWRMSSWLIYLESPRTTNGKRPHRNRAGCQAERGFLFWSLKANCKKSKDLNRLTGVRTQLKGDRNESPEHDPPGKNSHKLHHWDFFSGNVDQRPDGQKNSSLPEVQTGGSDTQRRNREAG